MRRVEEIPLRELERWWVNENKTTIGPFECQSIEMIRNCWGGSIVQTTEPIKQRWATKNNLSTPCFHQFPYAPDPPPGWSWVKDGT